MQYIELGPHTRPTAKMRVADILTLADDEPPPTNGGRQFLRALDLCTTPEMREAFIIGALSGPRAETAKPFDKVCDRLVSVLEEVAAELASARAAHGPQNSAHEGYAVLLEEVDELWDLVKQNPHKAPDATSDRERNKQLHRLRMRAEAIQVAAMAIRFVEDVCDGD